MIAFFEGGHTWSELSSMPVDEFMGIVQDANTIHAEQKAAAERAKNGK